MLEKESSNGKDNGQEKERERENILRRSITRTHRGGWGGEREKGRGTKGECERRKEGGGNNGKEEGRKQNVGAEFRFGNFICTTKKKEEEDIYLFIYLFLLLLVIICSCTYLLFSFHWVGGWEGILLYRYIDIYRIKYTYSYRKE